MTTRQRAFAGPPCPRTPGHGPLVRLGTGPWDPTASKPYWCPHHDHDIDATRPFFSVEEAAAAEAAARAAL